MRRGLAVLGEPKPLVPGRSLIDEPRQAEHRLLAGEPVGRGEQPKEHGVSFAAAAAAAPPLVVVVLLLDGEEVRRAGLVIR